MNEKRSYRWLLTALLFSVAIHFIALLGMALLLGPALDVNTAPAERAQIVADNVIVWRFGWAMWQLTALSDILLSALLLIHCLRVGRQSGQRGAIYWAGFGVVATVVALIPDQWGEALAVTTFVSQAEAIAAGDGDMEAYVLREGQILLWTGTCGGTAYAAMGAGWMMATALLTGWRRQKAFLLVGSVTWILFWAAAYFNYVSTSAALEGYPGFHVVFMLNATAFPILCLWMVWMAIVLGNAHNERHPAADRTHQAFRWPENRRGRLLAPIVDSAALRDIARILSPPMPTLASDITDIVYLNWLVPKNRVEHFLPPPLQLDGYGDTTLLSVLTYRHGGFGPKLLGPLRRILPSPTQSNWRLYTLPENETASRDAIYFFKTMIDSGLHVLGSRLFSDGLPSHLPLTLGHDQQDGRYETRIESGGGSAPDLHAAVVACESRALPSDLAQHFESWEAAVQYLIEQNRGVGVVASQGKVYESPIAIPLDVNDIIPAEVEFIQSDYLAELTEGCPPFAFIAPKVSFRAFRQRWVNMSEI